MFSLITLRPWHNRAPLYTGGLTVAIRLGLLVSLILAATACFADTSYTIRNLGNDNLGDIVGSSGLTSDGTVILKAFFCSDPIVTACYDIFNPITNTIGHTNIAPTTSFDNGAPCAPPPNPFGRAIQAVCNGDIQVVYAIDPGLYGLVPYIDIAGSIVPVPITGAPVAVDLNSEGYIAWDDGSLDELFEAVPNVPISQTPEPSTLLLVATGIISSIVMGRRRMVRSGSLSPPPHSSS